MCIFFFFSSRRRHTRFDCDWSSDVCSSDLVYPADGGTSAASPVAAGVAAALRQGFASDRLAPAQLKGLLQRTARGIGGNGWDYDLGYGVVDAGAALPALGGKPLQKRGIRRGHGLNPITIKN